MNSSDRLKQAVNRHKTIRRHAQATTLGTVVTSLQSIEQQLVALTQYVLNAIHIQLNACFDLEELRDIAFHLAIDIDNLPHTTKSELSQNLISYAIKNNRLNHLIREITARRPNISL